MKMKLYDDGNTGIALGNHFVETHAGNLHVYKDRTQAGDIVFITTDNFKKYVPIEWIDEYIKRKVKIAGMYSEMLFISDMVKEWENENAEVSD